MTCEDRALTDRFRGLIGYGNMTSHEDKDMTCQGEGSTGKVSLET